MTKVLYKIPLPETPATSQSDELGTVLSELSVIGEGTVVDAQSSQAPDLTLNGRFRYGTFFSTLLANELEELANSTFGNLPLFRDPGQSSSAGYYAIENAEVNPAHPTGQDVYEWDISLKEVGTKKSHFAAVGTRPTTVSHPFGNDTTPLVGIPAAARNVQAVDTPTSPTDRATPVPIETVQTAHGTVDRYDVTALAFENPIYHYTLAYDQHAPVDPRVYDTLDNDTKYIERENGRLRQWQTVFATGHQFTGAAILSNGALRVTIGEPSDPEATGDLTAEQWDDTAESWSAVTLPAEDWAPLDLDITRIGQARLSAQLVFEATADTTDASQGDTYAVNIELRRGAETLLVWIPSEDIQGPLPTDLQSLLSPIASSTVTTPQTSQQLVAREEVRL